MPGHVPISDVFNAGSSNTIKIMRVINPTDEICIWPRQPTRSNALLAKVVMPSNLRSDDGLAWKMGCRCRLISSGCHSNFRLIMMRVMA